MAGPFWVHPTNDRDKVGDERWNVALEEDIIATYNVGDANISIVVLSDDWKEGLLGNQDMQRNGMHISRQMMT